MGIAQAGTAVESGTSLAIQGVKASGIAVQGQVVWTAYKQWKLLAHVLMEFTGGNPTSAIDTTGATLIVAITRQTGTGQSVTDNMNNTWVTLPQICSNSICNGVYYCLAPVTSSQHTFTFAQGTGTAYTTIAVMAFGGNPAFFDQQTSGISNLNTQADVPLQTAPLTPSNSNALLVAGIAGMTVPITSIDSGFALVDTATVNNACASAYRVMENPASISPTWILPGNNQYALYGGAATLTCFKPSQASWQLLASTSAANPTLTTPAIDTTGATLLVAIFGTAGFGNTITDSSNNTWILGPNIVGDSFNVTSTIWYCLNPVTSTSHSFTCGPGYYPSFIVLAFSGPTAIIGDQQTTTQVSGGTTMSYNPLTPTANGSLIIAGATNAATFTAIDSGFAIAGNLPWVSTARAAVAAYLIQDNAASVAPTWTLTVGSYPGASATMLSFRPSYPWEFVGYAQYQNNQPSAPVDTTGANLFVHIIASTTGLTAFTDSANNTWSYVGDSGGATYPIVQMAYVINPITSTQHVFQGTGGSPVGIVLIYKCSKIISFNQFQVASGTTTSLTFPSITPTNNSLFVTFASSYTSAGITVDSGFAPIANVYPSGSFPVAVAQKISSTPESPTWTYSVNSQARAMIAAFNVT